MEILIDPSIPAAKEFVQFLNRKGFTSNVGTEPGKTIIKGTPIAQEDAQFTLGVLWAGFKFETGK